jgi:tetratricopeptide (TPR) repeat protein
MSLLRTTLAQAHLHAGNSESALHLLEGDAADAFASVSFDVLWLMGFANYAQVASELRASGPAAKLYELLAPYHEQMIFIGATAANPVAFYLGELASVLERYDQAHDHFVEATELNRRGGMTFAQAETELAWGKMLGARGGDLDQARSLVERARQAAITHGYARVERQATTALAKLA